MLLPLFALWAVLPEACGMVMPPEALGLSCYQRELDGPTKCWTVEWDHDAATPQEVVAVPTTCPDPPWHLIGDAIP
jgi:hypothetical protein